MGLTKAKSEGDRLRLPLNLPGRSRSQTTMFLVATRTTVYKSASKEGGKEVRLEGRKERRKERRLERR